MDVPRKVHDGEGCGDSARSNARSVRRGVSTSPGLSQQGLDVTCRRTVLCFNANNSRVCFLRCLDSDWFNQAGDGLGSTSPKIRFKRYLLATLLQAAIGSTALRENVLGSCDVKNTGCWSALGIYAREQEILARSNYLDSCVGWRLIGSRQEFGHRAIHLHAVLA